MLLFLQVAHMDSFQKHGGNLAAATAKFGPHRDGWIDLSTGINPCPYPIPDTALEGLAQLPDEDAFAALTKAAAQYYSVPEGAGILPVSGATAAISVIPRLYPADRVFIQTPTYSDHARSFTAAGWTLAKAPDAACVYVHPNNPDGRLTDRKTLIRGQLLTVIDESFADVADESLIDLAADENVIILKSFGKFFGLAGLRLGFVVASPAIIDALSRFTGPWQVSGPALQIGTKALKDHRWHQETRIRLTQGARKLDHITQTAGWVKVGGCDLFTTFSVGDAAAVQARLAMAGIWTRRFDYEPGWLRLGHPANVSQWKRLEDALK